MFGKKKKNVKKIVVNTDGDKFPEEMVNGVIAGVKKIGKSALKDLESNPELLSILQREMANTKEPGPEDVLLLYIYGTGAMVPNKAIPIPVGEENETLMLYLYSDGYLNNVGDLIYVNELGMHRLRKIGAIDKNGEILPPFK